MAAAAEPQAAAAAAAPVDLSDVSNTLIISLWRRVYASLSDKQIGQGMTVCRAFKQELPALVKHIDISRYHTNVPPQQLLEKIAATFKNLETLTINLQYEDHTPRLDFTRVCFPHLTWLSLHCAPITTVDFSTKNTPKLESLTLDNCNAVTSFRLQLPELKRVNIDFLEVDDESDFGRSLSSCPKLQRFTAYKLWGLGGTLHNLNLPECTQLSLYRSDDLEGLKLCAPKLTDLELRACYGLECVRLLPDPPTEDGQQRQPTPLRVNLINANIDRASKLHLKTHPRVKAPGGKFMTKESQDELYSMLYGGEGGDSEEGDSEDDEDGDPHDRFGLVGLAAQQMMEFPLGTNPQMAAMLAAGLHNGPFGTFLEHYGAELDGDDEDEWETDEEGGAEDHGDQDHDHDHTHGAAAAAAAAGGGGGRHPMMPHDISESLAMAVMGGMPQQMAMRGMQFMAAGYGDDSGSGEYDDEFEQEDDDEEEDEEEQDHDEEGEQKGDDDEGGDEGQRRGGAGAVAGGPSCTIEEIE